MAVLFVFYDATAQARMAETKVNDWRNRIPSNSRAQSMEEQYFVGRHNNVLILIYSEVPDYIQGLADTVQLKVKTKK